MVERVVRVTLAAQVSGYIQDFEKAERATRKAGSAAEDAAAKYERQNQAMRDMGVRMTAFGAVVVAATGLAVKAAIDWETAWAGVTKTVDGTPEQMGELEDSLRSLATTLPATHEEIAAVAEAAGQLGVQRENVAAFTRTMIDLSETTNLTADEAATSIAQIVNVMQTAPDQIDNLGAALVALGNDGASTERDIVQMAQRIAGAGRVVGLTEAQVLGFANALASVGIEAEAGGSAISRIMTDIAMSVSAGGAELEQFAEVAGMSSAEFQKSFKDDPADAIATFIEGLARIDSTGGDVFKILSDLGQSDIRVSQALLGMANSGDLLRDSLELGSKAWEENTALAEEAAKRYETTEAKIQVAGNAIRDAAIDFGTVFLPTVKAVAETIASLATGFSQLPGPVKVTVEVLTALAGAALLAGGAFLLAVPKIAEFSLALAVLRDSSIPGVARAAGVATGAANRMGRGFSAAAAFLTGPWGLALTAAAVGVGVLRSALDELRASSEEMENAAVTAKNADAILRTAFQGAPDGFLWDDGARAISEFQDRLRIVGEMQDNFFAKMSFQNQATAGDFNAALSRVGDTLGDLAATDLPAAQRAFQLLADKTDGSQRSQEILLEAMGSKFRDALVDRAKDLKIAATDQSLLNIAMEEAEEPALSAAAAYTEAAEEAGSLTEQIDVLLEAMNKANGVGQDAVSTNARWQSALAGVAAEVEKNGTSLDRNTVAGSANAAMLADVAKSADDAARAQYEQDLATMDAVTATELYVERLADQRQKFIDSALAAGLNKDEVIKLADEVFKLPDEKAIEVLVETAKASTEMSQFIADQSAKTIRIGVTTYSKGEDGLVVRVGDLEARAAGGILPGAPSSRDNMLIHAATGEYVVRASSVQRNRAALEYINAGGTIQGLARGGEVQPRYSTIYGGGGGAGGGATISREISLSVGPVYGADAEEIAERVRRDIGRDLSWSDALWGVGN